MYRFNRARPDLGIPGTRTFGKSEVSSPNIQLLLQAAQSGIGDVHCLCSGEPGLPMVPYKRTSFHLRKSPESGPDHLPGCVHHQLESSNLGLAPGSLWTEHGELIVDLDRMLRIPRPEFGDGSGGGERSETAYTPPLHGLLWLLLIRAGLHVDHVEHRWGHRWSDLAEGASSIRVASGAGRCSSRLLDRMLLPLEAGKTHADTVDSRFADELHTANLLLMATLIWPNDPNNLLTANSFSLRRHFGASVNVDKKVWQRAQSSCPDAAHCLAVGIPVLALGTLKVGQYARRDGSAGLSGWIQKLTLLSVKPRSLAPTPGNLRMHHAECMAEGRLFVATPSFDPLMHLARST